jgi:hypothetical protein
MDAIIGLLFSLITVGSALFAVSCFKKLKHEQERASEIDPKYAPVEAAESTLKTIENKYASLKRAYESDLESLKQSERKQSLFELGIGTTDETLYEPTRESATVPTLQDELAAVKDQIKGLRKRKKACQCEFGDDVAVNGRKAGAKKLFNREVRLRLRCLDNEFKMANAVIDWNNVNRLIERCKMAFLEINANGKIAKTYLRKPYLDLKLRELILQFEIKNLKAKLKEEEREQRQIEREAELAEARLKADAAKAKADREKMERLIQRELAKIETASPDQLALIEKHKEQLAQLRLKEARAISMAQLTRSGYIYVISNEMSFGPGVCKIGMTRRLDPNIRVRELGDASVPELFDVHAFAFTDDAPALEKFLHNAFEKDRVNLINRRKEFFQVDWQSVVSKIKSFGGPIELQELSRS